MSERGHEGYAAQKPPTQLPLQSASAVNTDNAVKSSLTELEQSSREMVLSRTLTSAMPPKAVIRPMSAFAPKADLQILCRIMSTRIVSPPHARHSVPFPYAVPTALTLAHHPINISAPRPSIRHDPRGCRAHMLRVINIHIQCIRLSAPS